MVTLIPHSLPESFKALLNNTKTTFSHFIIQSIESNSFTWKIIDDNGNSWNSLACDSAHNGSELVKKAVTGNGCWYTEWSERGKSFVVFKLFIFHLTLEIQYFLSFSFHWKRTFRDHQGKLLKSNEKNVQKPDKSRPNELVKHSNDPSDQVDFSKIPLPDIPSKKKQLNKGKSLSKDSLPTSASAKIQSKWKQLTDKEYFKKMHYRNSSLEKKPPTYLFGEGSNNAKPKDGIFLNRSGWLQTNQRLDKNAEARKENINKLKAANSKIEELISRSEARKANQQIANSKDDNVTILKIDPKSEARQILNDRPGFLPVKKNLGRDGPPPTPILSPPPAFQDHKIRNRIIEMKNGTRIQLSVTDSDNKTTPAQVGKGMVFSRSFEYDNRKTAEFNENFSRSFDFDFQLNENSAMNKNFLTRYGKSTTFASLTGKSPNYLTKKETSDGSSPSTSMTSIFPKVIPGNKVKMGNPNYYNPNYQSVDDGISRRSQFTRPGLANAYRSLESNSSSINNRLNSCDSGARSGKSAKPIKFNQFSHCVDSLDRFLERRFGRRSERWRWWSVIVISVELQVSSHNIVLLGADEKQSKHYENAAQPAAV